MKRVCAAALVMAWLIAQLPVAAAPDFEAVGREVIDELTAREFDKVVARFDAKMTEGLPLQKLAAVWDALGSKVGAFKAVANAKVQDVPAQQAHVVDLACEFAQTNLTIRVAFNDDSKIIGMFFLPTTPPVTAWTAPEYVNPSAFAGRDITVGPLNLPGTLLVPSGAGPFPAVVLVHGSGPADRDETVGSHKVFLDIGEGLASRGIATLRYDKRTLRTPLAKGATVKEEVLDDAQAAVALLESTSSINPKKIFVLGHSLGGMAAPWLARDNPRIAGLVIMAGAARPLEDALVDQLKYLAGPASPIVAAAAKQAEQIREGKVSSDTENVLGYSGAYWLALRNYRPAEVAALLRIPMLVLHGDRDYQVTLADFGVWQRELAGRGTVTLKRYAPLNHLFAAGTGPSRPEEYCQPGHVDAEVVDDVAGWITK